MKTKPYQPSSFLTTFLTSPIRVALALAATFALTQLAGAASYTWTNSGNWSSSTNWTPHTGAGGPLSTDTVIFGNTAASSSPTTVNNTVDLSFAGTIANLTNGSVASQAAGYVYVVTQIPSGQILTVSNSMFVGGQNEPGGTYATYAYMVGGGTLNVTGPSLTVQNYGSASGANACAYLNLSGLTNFVYYNTNGTISIENNPGSLTRLGGSMFLAAASNSITAANIDLGTSTSAQAGPSGSLASGVAAQLMLGPGTNIINASTINIANQKSTFTVTNSGGGLRIRGVTGADSDSAVNITIGNRNVGGGTGVIVGNLLLNGCMVDIKAGTLTIGENTGTAPSSANDGGTGVLQFDTGTVSANSLLMAYNSKPNANAATQALCNATLDVGAHGTLLIGAGQLFALATAVSTGPSTGTLIISNGLVNCQGPIVMGTNAGTLNGSIVFLTGGTLNMGPNSYVGTLARPVTTLTLTNCTLSVSIPSVSYTNICVQNLNWPVPDNNLTISVAAMPAGITNGTVMPFLNYSTAMTGTFNNPNLVLPPGVQGNLSLVGNSSSGTIFLTITGGVGPGTGGVEQLLNPSFGLNPPGTNWTAVGGTAVVSTSSTYPNTGSCTVDTRNVVPLTGTNVAKLTGSFVAGGSTNSWSQSVAVAAGSEFTAGGFTYVAHEDIMSGKDSFYYELDFRNTNGVLLAAYESAVVTNLTCGGPNMIPLDTWYLMPLTNQMQVTGGINTGVGISNVASGVFTAPPQTATAQFKAIFIQANATDTGSVYFSGPNFGFLAGPVPPTISAVTPNLVTLCTNTTLTCTATSTVTTISGFQVVATTTTLGGTVTNTTTYTVGSPSLTVTGIGTSSANISLALATNTIYQSVVVKATDADGVTVSSPVDTFDTLTPALVIEAADFNYTIGGNSGLFIDTPPNGGLALYTNLVGYANVDEYKIPRTAAQSYYRSNDAVIIQSANMSLGTPPSPTEQKFVTAAANGDNTDIEVVIAYDTPGDWLNYTRSFGSNATNSAPAGTYNVWCYLAVVGSGPQATFSQVTNDPTTTGQMTNFLGYFGSSTFTGSGGWDNFVYVPLVDQFGNRVAVTVTNVCTFKTTIAAGVTPNLGFYMFVPVAPVYTPVPLHVYPDGTQPFGSTGQFTFTVGPAQGASISTNGIGLILNGVAITSGLSFSQAGGGAWTVNYSLQSNAVYTAVINVTNTAGLTFTYSVSFDTFSQNSFMIEAEDFDFNGGQFIDNSIPTGAYVNNTYPAYAYSVGNSYFYNPAASGTEAIDGVDLTTVGPGNTPDAGETEIYRPNADAGTQVATDFLRGKFYVTNGSTVTAFSDFNVGWWNPGTWLNYTRTFPTNTYNVYGRLASSASYSGATMSLVTSGQGTSNQTTQLLGSFADPNANGFQSWHWVPLLDTNGQMVVVPLGGVETLKVTAPPGSATGSLNANFYMFVPAASAVHLSVSRTGSTISIQFPTQSGFSYTVLYSGSLNPANWQTLTTISGDGSVKTVTDTMGSSPRFYRVSAQ